MYNTSFIKKSLLALTVVFLYSCDKDFNAIGDDLIGDDHFGLESVKYDVVSYNQEISAIQSNALGVNPLGIYNDNIFSERTANFATQVSLASYAPSIGDEPEVVSVQLSIPYFSRGISTDDKGVSTYALDSIYGRPDGKFKLSVYESGVQMRASYFDNGAQYSQLYYTDQDTDFDNFKIPLVIGNKPLNNSEVKSQNEEFYFNKAEISDETKDATTGAITTTKSAPAMRLDLDPEFFETKILKAETSKLSSADVFQEYFKGLYFKVEKSGASPNTNMALMDFSKGKITIKYRAKTDITTDAETVKEDRSIVINLTGATASLQKDVKTTTYQTAISSPNVTEGDESLYLKGGQGSLAVIELPAFGSKLQEIRDNKWLVNEANLIFHIDTDKLAGIPNKDAGIHEAKRVYLYDLTNNIPILDYVTDGSSSVTTDLAMSKVIYSGIINVDATSGKGTTYKIRLTNHIRNLIKSTTAVNVKLGLAVSGDISSASSNKLKLKNNVISDAPKASVMSPLGTILYGGKSTVPDDKRLKLEVYYTKPN